MKQSLLFRLITLTALSLVIFCNANAQVAKSTFTFGAPAIINIQKIAEYEKDHPVILKKRFIEQGEDRDKFIFKPLPVDKNAKVQQLPQQKVTNQVTLNSPAPSQNFNGILDNGTLIPPDINGAAGINYIIETTNQQFNIYNKSNGSLATTVSITSLFSPSGLFNFYDPHITYDPNNNRFIIGIDAQTGSSGSSPSAFALAISQTGDPTGNWYIYKVTTTPNAPSDFMDYDELGFNNNWIVMTGNDFPAVGANKSYIYVWPRATLYAGGAGSATTFTDLTHLLISPATTYDASQNTLYMVSEYNGNSGGNGYVNIGSITGTAASPVYNAGSPLGINQPWKDPTALTKAPQSGQTAARGLEAGDTRINSVIYRNGSLWFTHAVFLPASGTITNSGVDWWQINPAALTVTQFNRIADVNAKIWYFYPSLNVNANNDMLVGYSASSATTFAGAQYALHLSTDAPNTVQTPVQFVNGLAGYYKTYGGGRNRWGDYSGTAFDPVDNSFWTFQEWPNTGNNWGTQIAHVPNTGIPACNTPGGSATSSITNTSATFGWTAVTGATGYNVQYRVVGTTTWSAANTATNSYNATGLTAGTNYEWQVQTVCSGTSTSAFTASTNFTTTGGCSVPTGLSATAITTTSATVNWGAVSGATSYNLQYKASTATLFTTINLTGTSYNLTGLTAGTTYQYQVQAVCGGGSSVYSTTASFQTSSGTITYCASKGNTTYEYLKTVVLGSINHTVGNDGGYGNYTNLSANLSAGTAYTIQLTPGFTGSSYREYYSVFIDYNQDGVLNGSGELVATGTGTGTAAISLSFTVPATAKNGSTRIRIQLKYGSASTNPCATLTYGDVHDYTVNIQGGTAPLIVSADQPGLQNEVLQNSLSVIPNPLTGKASATALYTLAKDGNTTLKVMDLAGRALYSVNLGMQNAGQHNYLLSNVTNNLRSGYYVVVLIQNSQVISSNRIVVGR